MAEFKCLRQTDGGFMEGLNVFCQTICLAEMRQSHKMLWQIVRDRDLCPVLPSH